MRKKTDYRIYILFSVLAAFFFTVTLSIQATPFTDDSLRRFQADISISVQSHFDIVKNDCLKIKKNMDDKEEGQRYLTCVTENFETGLLTWSDKNKEFLTIAKEVLGKRFKMNLDADTPAETARLSAATVGYIHSCIRNWYQSLADVSRSAYNAHLLGETKTNAIMEELQAGLHAQTSLAKEQLEFLKNEANQVPETMGSSSEEYLDKVFEPMIRQIESVHAKMYNDLERIQNQIPTDFGHRPDRYHEVTALYENIIVESFKAIVLQPQNMWESSAGK